MFSGTTAADSGNALQGGNWLGAKVVKGLASIDEGLENANILSSLDPLAEGEAMVNAQTGELANDYSDVSHLPLAAEASCCSFAEAKGRITTPAALLRLLFPA